MIVSQFDLYESMSVAPFFNLTFVVNYGFAFGFLNNPSLNQIVVSIVILSIIIYFLYLLIKTQDRVFKICLIRSRNSVRLGNPVNVSWSAS